MRESCGLLVAAPFVGVGSAFYFALKVADTKRKPILPSASLMYQIAVPYSMTLKAAARAAALTDSQRIT